MNPTALAAIAKAGVQRFVMTNLLQRDLGPSVRFALFNLRLGTMRAMISRQLPGASGAGLVVASSPMSDAIERVGISIYFAHSSQTCMHLDCAGRQVASVFD